MLFSLLGLLFGTGVWLMFRELRRAPAGYQDADGFHQIGGERPQVDLRPASSKAAHA
jgi:hypothetical protein